MTKPIPILLMFLACLWLAPGALAAGENPPAKMATNNLEASVLGSGGMMGQSLLHRHQGTLGQPQPIGIGSSPESVLRSGFWSAQLRLLVSPVLEMTPLINQLWQNAPNPFNPLTTIKFSIADPSLVELAVFSVRGEKIRTLVNEKREPGVYTEIWNGRDDAGGQAASGVYIYRLSHGNQKQTNKMLLVK